MKIEQYSDHPVLENVSRRNALKGIVSGGGLILAAQFLPLEASANGSEVNQYATGAGGMPGGAVWDPHVFVSIAKDGTVTIVTHRSEMGTGSRTSLPMVVADEMEADWAKVKIVQAPGNEAKYGNQDTDGSRSIRHFIQPKRACGAAARQMLEKAAALAWSVPDTEVRAQNHKVVHVPTGKTIGYGELAEAAAALPTPKARSLTLKDPSQFRYIGKGNVQITDLMDITMGKAVYAQDVRVPDMLYAVIERPPVVLGKAVKWDEAAASAVPGVKKVMFMAPTPMPAVFAPLGGVAVIATSTYAALKGSAARNAQW